MAMMGAAESARIAGGDETHEGRETGARRESLAGEPINMKPS